MMSGFTCQWSWPNSLPVRPKPETTSSKISSTPYSSQISRTRGRYSVRRNQHAAAGDDRLHQQRGNRLRPFINDRFLKRLRAGDTVFGRAEFWDAHGRDKGAERE